MADNTQNFALPFPEGADAVVPHLDIENLAVATDASLKVVSNSIQSVEQGTTEIVERIDQEIEEIKGDVQNLGSVNVEEIMSSLEASQAELEAAKEDFSISQAEMQGLIDQLNEERLPELEDALEKALEAFDGDFQDFLDRYKDFEDDIEQAKSDIADAKNRLNVTESDVADAKADAATAKTDADKAIADALEALGVAEGKGQIIAQVSAPTGSRAKEENFWVRLPDHKVHYYDGESWVEVTDPELVEAAQEAAEALTEAKEAKSKADALELSVDGPGGLKDRLETAEDTLENSASKSELSNLDNKLATLSENAENKLQNPSFEYGDEAWSLTSRSSIIESEDAYHGNNLLEMHSSGSLVTVTYAGGYLPTQGGDVWELYARIKRVDGGTNGYAYVMFQMRFDDGRVQTYTAARIGGISSADISWSDEWQKLVGTHTMPEGVVEVIPLIRTHGSMGTGGIVHVDTVSMKDMSSIFVESILNAVWAELGVFDRLEAREGWVGGVNLENGAVTAEKMTITGDLAAAIISADKARVADLIAEDLIANNATLINAAIQSLTVTEKANLVEALVDQLYADEFTARVASMARATIAAPNMLPHALSEDVRQFFQGGDFGVNSSDPSIWVRGPKTVVTNGMVRLTEGETYKFSTEVAGSVNGTRYYIDLVPEGDGNWTSWHRMASDVTAGTKSTWLRHEHTFTSPVTHNFHIKIYANHNRGADNPTGYQWFRNMRLQNILDGNLIVENSIKAAQLDVQNIFSDSIVANQIYASAVRAKLLEADEALIGGTLLKNNAVTTDKIAANAITAGKVAANAITAGKISGNAITADKIAGGAIDGKTITGATITGGVVRTSASGARVQMQNDALTAYNASNTVQARYSGSGIELRPPGGTLTSIGPHIFGSEVITHATNQPWVSGTTIAEGSSNGWSSFLTNATNTVSFTCVSTDYVIDFSFMYIPGGGNMNEANASVLSQIQMARTSSDSRTVMNRTFYTRGWFANTEYPLNYTAKITVPASWIGTSMYPRFQFRSRAVNWGASVHSFIFKATPT